MGRYADRMVHLNVQSQSILAGAHKDFRKEWMAPDAAKYSTQTIQRGIRSELRCLPGSDQSSVSIIQGPITSGSVGGGA